MQKYPWDETSREALSSVTVPDNHPNPIGRNETDEPPPVDIPPGFVARAVVTGEGWFQEWELVVDNRGETYWAADGTEEEVQDIASTVPAGCLVIPPPSSYHRTHDGTAWVFDTDARGADLLAECEGRINKKHTHAVDKLARWMRIAERAGDTAAIQGYTDQIGAWDDWAESMSDLMDNAEFPWPGAEVPWPEPPPKPKKVK